MISSIRYTGCISTLWTILFFTEPLAGTKFVPRDVAAGETRLRRACEPAAPDVNASSIIANICNQALVNEFNQCPNQLVVSIQKSTANTCGQYSDLFADCMLANNNDSVACSDPHLGYQDCAVYTLQAYAYCACYYTLPKSVADCANQQLQSQPQAQNTTTLLVTNTPLTATPINSEVPASAVTADTEFPPSDPIPSEGITSATNPGPFPTSDPQITSPPSNSPGSNKQLQPQPQFQNTTTLLATIPTGSKVPASAVPADQEESPPPDPTPSADNGMTTPDDQDPPSASSAPQIVPTTSPLDNPDPETTTVVSTYTTTIYTAITTATIITTITTAAATSASSTFYTCFSSEVTTEPAVRDNNGSEECVGCRRGRRSKIF